MGVYYLELIGTFLLFSPLLFFQTRIITLALFALMHIAFRLCLAIGLFPFFSLAALLLFIPSGIWDKFYRSIDVLPTLFVDDSCSFCLKASRMIREFLFLREVAIEPASSNPAVQVEMNGNHSWIVQLPSGELKTRWDAFVSFVSFSPVSSFCWPLLTLGRFRKLGDSFSRIISYNHDKFALYSRSLLPLKDEPIPRSGGIVSGVFVLCALLLVLFFNVGTVRGNSGLLASRLEWAVIVPRFDQYWNMFAPKPYDLSGWYVIDGILESGQPVDVYNERETPVSWERPKNIAATFKNDRWSKYMMGFATPNSEGTLLAYGQFLCRKWNVMNERKDRLKTFNIYFMNQLINDNSVGPLNKTSLWSHVCF